MSDPFPFIVARGRSGTTLLRAMLDSHRDVAVPPESHFVVPMLVRRRQLEHRGYLSTDAFLADLATRYGFRRWELSMGEVEAQLRRVGPIDVPQGIRELFRLYAAQRGKSRYAEKTPINVLHIDLLATAFPEAKFIHLIRDGRDVALSYLDTDFGVDTLADAAIYWRRFVRAGRRGGRMAGLDRYREVRYEELVARPETVLRSLCDFLELAFDERMLRYHGRAEAMLQNTSHRDHHSRIALPPTQGLRDWRRDMDMGSVEFFEALAGDLLDELGYERATPQISGTVRVQALRAKSVLMVRRAGGRIGKKIRAGAPIRSLSAARSVAMHSSTEQGETGGGIT
jgi:hypothetical protein